MRKFSFYFLVFVFLFSCKKEESTGVKYWYDNIGSRTDVPFFPDGSCNYIMFSFIRKSGDNIGYRLKAKFMYARYQSYNVYDLNTLSSLSSIADKDILPNSGSTNPFISLNTIRKKETIPLMYYPMLPKLKLMRINYFFQIRLQKFLSY